jgi:hypothetical protein
VRSSLASLRSRARRVELAVEQQHVHPRLAQHTECARFDVRVDDLVMGSDLFAQEHEAPGRGEERGGDGQKDGIHGL